MEMHLNLNYGELLLRILQVGQLDWCQSGHSGGVSESDFSPLTSRTSRTSSRLVFYSRNIRAWGLQRGPSGVCILLYV